MSRAEQNERRLVAIATMRSMVVATTAVVHDRLTEAQLLARQELVGRDLAPYLPER